MASPIVTIEKITKSYQKNTILNALDWQVEKGDIIALLGKNGAGKSTLLESIMNLRQVNSGSIKLWDTTWEALSQKQRGKISFVEQSSSGFEWMKAGIFLDYLGSFFTIYNQQYCYKLCDNWGIDKTKKIGDLSGGQTQMLHVIQALSTKPELLILDEPVAHLDPNMRRQFISEIVDLSCEMQSTVIFSSHIVSDLERVANKVALLKNGQIEKQYDVEKLKASINHVKISADIPLQQSEYFAELSDWCPQIKGATAKIIKPLKQPLEDFIAHSEYKIQCTPISMEDWYLEVSNESL